MMQIAILSAGIVDSPRGWFSLVYAVPFQASLPGFFKACLSGFANRRSVALVLVVRGDVVQPVVEPDAVVERSHAGDFGRPGTTPAGHRSWRPSDDSGWRSQSIRWSPVGCFA
ncbi:hypothetical protein DKM19_00920 [Streptosporangium sp. 'caverna']|nr:hypothetical protein DKM19_00920 [Streptosporangium sp. 'caverna']